jgi:hypothetical protein
MMLPLLLTLVSLPHAGPRAQPVQLLPDKETALVYGKALKTRVDEKEGLQWSDFQITRVYLGDRKLKGQTFNVVLPTAIVYHNTMTKFQIWVDPWVKAGEEGIWWIYIPKSKEDDKPKWFAYLNEDGIDGYPMPARKDISAADYYKAAVVFAEAAEVIDRAPERDRIDLLKKAIGSTDLRTGIWATRVLLWNAPDRIVELVRDELPKEPPNPVRLRRIVKHLGDDSFERREAATKELTDIGLEAVPALCRAMVRSPSLEVRRRIAEALKMIDRRLQERSEARRASWTVLRLITRESASRPHGLVVVFRGLQDLAEKHPESWLALEMSVVKKLNPERRTSFSDADHWNALGDVYWGKPKREKKRD